MTCACVWESWFLAPRFPPSRSPQFTWGSARLKTGLRLCQKRSLHPPPPPPPTAQVSLSETLSLTFDLPVEGGEFQFDSSSKSKTEKRKKTNVAPFLIRTASENQSQTWWTNVSLKRLKSKHQNLQQIGVKKLKNPSCPFSIWFHYKLLSDSERFFLAEEANI